MNTTAVPGSPESTSAPGSRPPWSFFQGPVARLLMLLALWLLLRIPLSMITDLVHERQARRDAAAAEVTGTWGGRQQLIGPVLRVPYIQQLKDAQGKTYEERHAAYLLPESCVIDATLDAEERRRGIFRVPVYTADLLMSGHFRRPDSNAWMGSGTTPIWQEAEVQVGLSDVRAIHADGRLVWNGHPLAFEPSAGTGGPAAGVHVPLGNADEDPFGQSQEMAFKLALSFNGSDALQLAPVCRNTTATLKADWGDPSFQGAWLPTRSQVEGDRFRGDWSISYLGRGYPQHWTSAGSLNMETLSSQLFGVTLLTPVDAYRMSERVTKYAVLAAFFTFLTLWLTEVLSKGRVHPIQYLLVGAALTLFGLLELAVGEHFGFEPGFLVATLAVTGMVTAYAKTVLLRWRRAGLVGGLLGGLYGYLYLLLRAEDYALLGGSIALFLGLGAVMVLTRKIDWHRLGNGGG